MLVLSTSKILSTQFGMTDFQLSYYKLMSVAVLFYFILFFQFNK